MPILIFCFQLKSTFLLSLDGKTKFQSIELQNSAIFLQFYKFHASEILLIIKAKQADISQLFIVW